MGPSYPRGPTADTVDPSAGQTRQGDPGSLDPNGGGCPVVVAPSLVELAEGVCDHGDGEVPGAVSHVPERGDLDLVAGQQFGRVDQAQLAIDALTAKPEPGLSPARQPVA